ncbi:MAG: response regulator [Saprospiraceae bacterium]|nr:response regulator [Candidatus Parvibacillus calidus]
MRSLHRNTREAYHATRAQCNDFGKIDSIKSSVEFLRNNSVDLIFMDIQLSDGISFRIFDQVEVVSPIIFTTAYDSYAINAFKVNSIDYLLKSG